MGDDPLLDVVYLTHSAEIGGAETNLLNVLDYSAQGRFRPAAVLLPEEGPLQRELADRGIRFGFIRYRGFRWRNPLPFLHCIFDLVSCVRRSGAVVMHLNHQWLIEHAAIAARITGLPLVCHVRNLLHSAFVARSRHWLNRADALVCVSHATKVRAEQLGLSSPVHLVQDGLDLARFQQFDAGENERLASGIPLKAPTIGFCGRIVPEKGVEDLILAAALVLKEMAGVRFVFVGSDGSDGAYIDDLTGLAEEIGVREHIHFLGFQRHVEMILSTFDVLAVPSRREMAEGLPLTILEGIASGCLIVATPNSGTVEVIEHMKSGILTQPNDPLSLAQGLVQALTLPAAKTASLKKAASNLVYERHAIQRQVRRLGCLYRDLSIRI